MPPDPPFAGGDSSPGAATPRVVLLMGVAGAGKTAVGRRLAERLGAAFYDGDDLHPPDNVRKMASGAPLNDRDRLPWLESIHRLILENEAGDRPAVIACSALKRAYRELLLDGAPGTRIVYLRVARETLEERLRLRKDHFFDPVLLASQLETLEEPRSALIVEGGAPVESVVDEIVARLDGA